MTILDTLPPLRTHGALQVSHAPLDDLGLYRRHYAFCDDTYRGNPGTLRDYANLLRGSTRWSFWWD